MTHTASLPTRVRGFYAAAGHRAAPLEAVTLLLLRLAAARVFWLSGLGKVETFDLGPLRLPTPELQNSTKFLFRSEFFPDLPRAAAEGMAVLAAAGELILPVLLMLGLFARIGALGLLITTLVIQIFVFPGEWWSVHVWWAVILAHLAVRGPGVISLDRRFGLEKSSKS